VAATWIGVADELIECVIEVKLGMCEEANGCCVSLKFMFLAWSAVEAVLGIYLLGTYDAPGLVVTGVMAESLILIAALFFIVRFAIGAIRERKLSFNLSALAGSTSVQMPTTSTQGGNGGQNATTTAAGTTTTASTATAAGTTAAIKASASATTAGTTTVDPTAGNAGTTVGAGDKDEEGAAKDSENAEMVRKIREAEQRIAEKKRGMKKTEEKLKLAQRLKELEKEEAELGSK